MSDCKPLAKNHERIWLQPLCCTDERCWCEDPQPCDDCGLPAIEYVRADLVALPLHDAPVECNSGATWQADAIRYRTALLEISNHWANQYDHPRKQNEMYRGSYGIGVTDGHRACKSIADRVLAATAAPTTNTVLIAEKDAS